MGDVAPRDHGPPLNSGSRLDQADLLNEQVHPDELQELLSRLASADALFADPVPTIRDVAEATDASPLLIGRILSELRNEDEGHQISGLVFELRERLEALERLQSDRYRTNKVEANTPERILFSDFDAIPWSLLKSAELTPEDEVVAQRWDEQRKVYFTWIVQAAVIAFLLFVVWAYVSYRSELGWNR